jgi:HD-GYP domain-containing protein (c-di-GMP phosphodiesterase class II)
MVSERQGKEIARAIKEGAMQTDTKKTKLISISDLRPGMYVLELDQPWIKTPFFRHRFLVQSEEEIASLKQYAVRQVMIDPSRGLDVEVPTTGHRPPTDRRGPLTSKADARAEHTPATVESPSHGGFKGAEEVARESSREAVRAARAIRGDAVTALRDLFAGTKTGIPLESLALQGVVRDLLSNLLTHQAATTIMRHLERLQQTNRSSYEHAVDVAVMSLMMGRAHGLRPHQLNHLGLGALMHDLGEMDLPGHIQRPAGPLSPEEEALFREHPRRGAAILSRTKGVPEPVHRIVWEHHERVDGSGYPYGLQGAQIPLLSQIVGLADSYDSMINERAGRKRLSGAEAIRSLFQLGKGAQFDQNLIERMIQCLGVYPVGTLVALNTGEQGWVIAGNTENRVTPWIKLAWDGRGERRFVSDIVDLSSPKPGEPERTITKVLNPQQEGVDCYSILAC